MRKEATVSMGLIAQVRWARRYQLKRDIDRAHSASEFLRMVQKDRDNSGDRGGHDLATTARLAIDDLIEHLEARL